LRHIAKQNGFVRKTCEVARKKELAIEEVSGWKAPQVSGPPGDPRRGVSKEAGGAAKRK